ncbi:hypothetical protein OT109_03285 [Phycisphaeraceae bacterium D3-23]
MAWRLGWVACAASVSGLAGVAGVVAAQPVGVWFADVHLPAEVVDAGPAEVRLLGVVPLPEHPTAAEVGLHLQAIAEATQALQQAPQRDDPQAALLDALADDYLDELVQAHEMYPVLRYYLDPIIHREIAQRGGPDIDRLSSIVLRDGADERAAWSYVMDIARATRGQRRVSANDVQVEMLQALAAEHMRVLIDAIELDELRFYALLAVKRTADASHKDIIIAALPDQPRLIGLLRQHGWAEDARDTLIMGLEQGVDYMPRTWVQVMVELNDPATYDALALHLARSRGSRTYYNLMRTLPGIELDSAVCAAWERVNTTPNDARELREVSEIAVGHGHAGALAHLVALLPSDDMPTTQYDAAIRQAVLAHIEFLGSNSQIKAWHEANKDRLVFSVQGSEFYAAGMLQ